MESLTKTTRLHISTRIKSWRSPVHNLRGPDFAKFRIQEINVPTHPKIKTISFR